MLPGQKWGLHFGLAFSAASSNFCHLFAGQSEGEINFSSFLHMLSSVSTSIYGKWGQDGSNHYSHFKFSFVNISETGGDKAYSS